MDVPPTPGPTLIGRAPAGDGPEGAPDARANAEEPARRVRLAGAIRDRAGRPLVGAAAIPYVGGGYADEAVTDRDGRFAMTVALPPDETRVLVTGVARGHLAADLKVAAQDRDDLEFRLDPDDVHGRLELTILRANGDPAADARAWVFPSGDPWPGVPPRQEDPIRSATRTLRGRLERGWDLADAGRVEVGQGGCGLGFLEADERGRVVVPACEPGTYRVLAVEAVVVDEKPLTAGERLWVWAYGGCIDDGGGSGGTIDARIEVDAPPATSARTVRLRPARSVLGRVVLDEDPRWSCGEASHSFDVVVDGWPWTRATVRLGPGTEKDGSARVFDGRFRIDGVTRTACRLSVHSSHHPLVEIDLRAVGDSDPDASSVLEIRVPDTRRLTGCVHWPVAPPSGAECARVRIEGAGPATGTLWASTHRDPGVGLRVRYQVDLERPLLEGDVAVVTVSDLAMGEREWRVPMPALLREGRGPIVHDLVIPDPPGDAR
jgi:hypothetical protein